MMILTNEDLYEDAVIEILLRLPVKSLLRFKSVCKFWYSLIENPSFISKHLKNVHSRLIVIYMDEDDGTAEFYYPQDMFCMFPDETLTDLSLQNLETQQPIPGGIGGPFDGIYCIYGIDDGITLWNLATGESRMLPKYRATRPRYTSIRGTNVGFGLDPMSNDYKLVMIFSFWDENRNDLHEFSNCAIYNLRTNSWLDFVCFKTIHYLIPHSQHGKYLDGICHWLWELEDNNQEIIISFHMGNQVFQEIQCPNDIAGSAYVTLGLYDDFLSLLLLNKIKNCIEIWVMKLRIWGKHLSVGPLVGISEPLGLWKNGGFFVQSDSQRLLLYDPNTKEMRDLGLTSFSFSVHNYKESLIPIKEKYNFSNFFDIPWHVLGVY